MAVAPEAYLLLSAGVFAIGLFGVLVGRNALGLLLSVELMLNAANINLVAFAFVHGNLSGQVLALFVIALAAAEVAVGIGVVLSLQRTVGSIDIGDAAQLRW
jgi:NADH-quinone oxidoreductase subunit K